MKAYAFHIGVMRALEEHGFYRVLAKEAERKGPKPAGGIPIGVYIGSSAGACAAAACIFFESLDEAEGVIGLRKTNTPRFSRRVLYRPNLRLLLDRAGLCDASGVERYFRDRATNNDFRQIDPEVFICATQLNGSRKVIFGPRDSAIDGVYNKFIAYYNNVPISKAVAASVSVPGIFRPYALINPHSQERFEYTDGEVRETLSVHIARDNEVDLVVVSNVWMPYHYDPTLGTVSNLGIGHILGQTVTQIIEQKVDRFRNEFDRYAAAFETIRQFGKKEGLAQLQIDRLLAEVSEVLRYREMDEIFVCPDRYDTRFNLAPKWSFNPKHLRFARDTGYERAQLAISKWHQRHEEKSLTPNSIL